jgi:hypothetical protein
MVVPTKAAALQSTMRTECHNMIQRGLGMFIFYLSLAVGLTKSISVDSEGKELYRPR